MTTAGLTLRRYRVSLVLVVAALLCFLQVFDQIAEPLAGPLLDISAENVVNGIAARAATAFALSKTINGALSFAEEIAVSGGFIVEGSMHPGSVLAPVNNLVDQFARLMLVVAAAALFLKLLLHIGAALGTSLLLAIVLGLFALQQALGPVELKARVKRLANLALILVVVARLLLPISLALTGLLSETFLADRFDQASTSLASMEEKAQEAATAAEEESWAKRIGRSVAGYFAAVRDSFGDLFQSVVTMITIFFMETVFLPLVLAFALYRGASALIGRRRDARPPEHRGEA
jgi:hypothetical protein